MFHDPASNSLNQAVLDNYNRLASALKGADVHLKKIDEDGMCAGLSTIYLLSSHEGRLDDFYFYLNYLASLNEKKIIMLGVKCIQQDSLEGIEIGVANKSIDSTPKTLNDLIDFLRIISKSQKHQPNIVNVHAANWEDSELIFCDKKELSTKLKETHLKAGKYMVGKHMLVSLGMHEFAIERVTGGFRIFEPNNFLVKEQPLLETMEEVADVIIENIIHSDFFTESNSNIALCISYYSFGNENSELDDLIARFADEINEFEAQLDHPLLTSLIRQHRRGKMSRADLALNLHDIITQHRVMPEFEKELAHYLTNQGIKDYQAVLANEIKENPLFLSATAYVEKNSILDLAVHSELLMVTRQLLAMGADPNVKNINGYNSLHTAIEKNKELVNELLQMGANPNLQDSAGYTPLHLASLFGNTKIVKLLLMFGAEPNIQNVDGETALHIAAGKNYIGIIDLLLRFGADPFIQNKYGYSASLIAVIHGQREAAEQLTHVIGPMPSDIIQALLTHEKLKNERKEKKEKKKATLQLQKLKKPDFSHEHSDKVLTLLAKMSLLRNSYSLFKERKEAINKLNLQASNLSKTTEEVVSDFNNALDAFKSLDSIGQKLQWFLTDPHLDSPVKKERADQLMLDLQDAYKAFNDDPSQLECIKRDLLKKGEKFGQKTQLDHQENWALMWKKIKSKAHPTKTEPLEKVDIKKRST